MTDAGDLPALSETQWEIMNVIWERGACPVADVWKTLNAKRGVSRNAIQTQIVRLEEKGWLTHTETDNGFLYRPTVSREESQQTSVQKLIETVFDGSLDGLVATLLNGGSLSSGEAERIRQRISQARRKKT
ncbi:BlaI/MecI/CopY family transcriptional regulator [Schlesneria paludicola]|uniref:BlaI/MecI/CopY family transcriptional regulator n=1 Tax=Schlesneria paludicola TaxID=360056 RepID=UPI00029A19F3|nr:BlaI/MecI/CopY family transcriptional regulator [Schlesneria paludicola]